MLRDDLIEITKSCVYQNDKFKTEYNNIVEMLVSSAENGELVTRVKNISPCVLNVLKDQGITYGGYEYMGDVFYDLKWF